MLLIELRFFLFFAVIFLAYWAIPQNRARKLLLLAASFFFYALWNWRYFAVLLGTTLIDFAVALRMDAPENRSDEAKRRRLLIMSLVSNVAILFYFKQWNFFVDSAVSLSQWLGLPLKLSTAKIIIPIGLSFHTFQGMSYSIDNYRRKIQPTRSLLDFSLYIAFFPQLLAGPIVRASDLLPKFRESRLWTDVDFRRYLILFLAGFFKKACVSDNISLIVDSYYSGPGAFSARAAALAVILFPIQVYCDFSGYSDMAIAASGLLGFPLPRNFDFPFFSSNLGELWSRWHISLTSWFRDYIYIPLGGNRGGDPKTAKNLMIVHFISGLWHGSGWTYLAWGAVNGVEQILTRPLLSGLKPALRPLGMLLTLYCFTIAVIFFRARSVPDALMATHAFATFHSYGTREFSPVLWVVPAGLTVLHWISYRIDRSGWKPAIPRPVFYLIYGAAFEFAIALSRTNYLPFIYFQF